MVPSGFNATRPSEEVIPTVGALIDTGAAAFIVNGAGAARLRAGGGGGAAGRASLDLRAGEPAVPEGTGPGTASAPAGGIEPSALGVSGEAGREKYRPTKTPATAMSTIANARYTRLDAVDFFASRVPGGVAEGPRVFDVDDLGLQLLICPTFVREHQQTLQERAPAGPAEGSGD